MVRWRKHIYNLHGEGNVIFCPFFFPPSSSTTTEEEEMRWREWITGGVASSTRREKKKLWERHCTKKVKAQKKKNVLKNGNLNFTPV